jgi:microcystin-dependent protein
MAEPFLGEIRVVSFGFAPKGWALCNGQIMAINQNQALFSILGTTYGGNGQTTFALPNLQGSTPIHFDPSHVLGTSGGAASVTLTAASVPPHQHTLSASADFANSSDPTGKVLGAKTRFAPAVFAAPSNLTPMNPTSVQAVGGSQPHNNMQPFLTLNFVIAVQGIFPSQN